jgi:2-C-methyl-D-erythritol 4-phosphate cytidylyltransferase
METPQVFELSLLMSAYEKVIAENSLVTDEVSAVQAIGVPVRVVTNEQPNPKITFPEDLVLAEQLLRGAIRQAESGAS